MIHTVRIRTNHGPDLLGEGLLQEIKHTIGIDSIDKIQTTKIYRLEGINQKEAKKLSEQVLCESINQTYTLNNHEKNGAAQTLEIGYKPGVMNPEVASLLKIAKDLGINLTAASTL